VSDDSNETAVMILAALLGAFIAFAIAYWLWPWLGPQIFNPCPQWTGLGIGLYAGWNALRSIGGRMRQADLDQIKRRLRRLEERR
jgi:hypothetical protein